MTLRSSRLRYHTRMTARPKPKTWVNPVKNHPPKAETLNTPGDFGKFTELMKKVVNGKPSSRVPGASDRS
jgi:hypothetical protein